MKLRGFEPVRDEFRQNYFPNIREDALTKVKDGMWVGEVQLPVRGSLYSAGYDFYAPRAIQILPDQRITVFTDVMAYMQAGEVLQVYPRSSMGAKGLQLCNTVGIVDKDYYNNRNNGGNIGLMLHNTSGRAIDIAKGERIAQGIFMPFLLSDADQAVAERVGGFGSTGE